MTNTPLTYLTAGELAQATAFSQDIEQRQEQAGLLDAARIAGCILEAHPQIHILDAYGELDDDGPFLGVEASYDEHGQSLDDEIAPDTITNLIGQAGYDEATRRTLAQRGVKLRQIIADARTVLAGRPVTSDKMPADLDGTETLIGEAGSYARIADGIEKSGAYPGFYIARTDLGVLLLDEDIPVTVQAT